MAQSITDKDRQEADYCLTKCTGCTGARKNQKGFKYWVVKLIGVNFCPNCKAYAKVYGQRAYQPIAK